MESTNSKTTPPIKPPSTMEDQVELAFSDASTSNYVKDYLEVLQTNLRDTHTHIGRTTLLFISLIATFELIIRAEISEVTLGPFKLKDLSIIEKLLPVIISYCFFDLIAYMGMRNRLSNVHRLIMKKFFKPIHDAKLHLFLEPIGMNIYDARFSSKKPILRTLENAILNPILIVIGLAPITFEIYAFTKLFIIFGHRSILIWLSIIVSMAFIIRAYIGIISYNFERQIIPKPDGTRPNNSFNRSVG